MVLLKKGFKKAVESLEKTEEGEDIHMHSTVETLVAKYRPHLLARSDMMKVKNMQEVFECQIIH